MSAIFDANNRKRRKRFMEDTNIHASHRERLRENFVKGGFDFAALSDVQALELLLTYAIPRKDTNPIAHALLDRFKLLGRIFDADVSELQEVDGIGESAAVFLKVQGALLRYYMTKESGVLSSSRLKQENWNRYITAQFLGFTTEHFIMFCLDSANRLLSKIDLSTASSNSVMIDPPTIVRHAVISRASKVILAHNHPSGNIMPSNDDIKTTRCLDNALRTVGVTLSDHVIVADGELRSVLHSM